MARIVLVHGAWYGAWCWQRVVAQLRTAGHTVVAPDLPAHGADVTPVSDASLASYVARVAESIQALGAEATVVGHSAAGVVLSELGERHPDLVSRLVYLAAYMVRDSETIFQHATTDAESALGQYLRPDEKAGTIAVADDGYAAALAYGCEAADIQLARSKARPDPLAPLGTPVHLTPAAYGSVSRVFIKTLRDRAVSTALQTKLLAAHPTETWDLASGHSPFLSHPEELAALIARAAR